MSTGSIYDPEFGVVVPEKRKGCNFGCALSAIFVLFVLVTTRTAYDSATQAGIRGWCANNLKYIGLALHNYEQAYGVLPPAYTVDANGQRLHSWRTLILPFVEQDALYKTIDLTKPWDDPANARALENTPCVYCCPCSRERWRTLTTYLASTAPGGCFLPHEPRKLADITDSTANTLAVIEAADENAIPWMAPLDADESVVMSLGPKNTKLYYMGTFNALMADGSVKSLKATLPAPVRRALISISADDGPDPSAY